MLWQDRVYLAAAGAGTVLSVAHYLATVKSVTASVPIHFNFFGVPDRFAAPWAFVLYPISAIIFGATAVGITASPSITAALPPNSLEQVTTRSSLLCGYVAVVACQLYATRIANGSASRLPNWLLGVLYSSVLYVLGAAVAVKCFK